MDTSVWKLNSILLAFLISSSVALRCRSGEGPSDENFKRIARSCMRKIGESSGRYHQDQSENSYGNFGTRDYDEMDMDDRLRQSNRDRFLARTSRSKRSGNDRRYDQSSNNNARSQGSNQRSNNNHGNMNNSNSSHSDRQSRDIQREQDGACVVHCFFEELNTLNNDDYPDQHKVNFVLTKDIRDRELRGFYTDTIQECFHYLDHQRRKDRCQFSKDLINCMTQYARANCEDWQDHTLIFT